MPNSNTKKFNQSKYIENWKKENMKSIKVRYRNEFVDDFKSACSHLGVSQSSVFKKAMEETIRKAGLK